MKDPETPSIPLEQIKARLAEATDLHRKGKPEEAEPIYYEILAQYPNYPDALNFLGILLHQKGLSASALQLIGKAIEFDPEYFDAYFNIGRIYMHLGRMRRAEEFFAAADKLRPNRPEVMQALNQLREKCRADEEMLEALRLETESSPEDADAHYRYGLKLRNMERMEEAARALRNVIALRPDVAEGYLLLSRIYQVTDRREDMESLLREWLAHIPDDPNAQHMFWAMTGEHTPDRASNDYVAQTFDRFAESFDQVLRSIDYRAPQLVAELAAELAENGAGNFGEVLDAGCGTGLCGPLLKPMCKRLTGVDLSRNMLDKALERNCYEALFQGELTEFIGACDRFFDLIVSADTLVYFGDLFPPAKASFDALKPGGHFIFTVEQQEEHNDLGYTLRPHGRYSHEREYVRNALQDAGFEVASLDIAILRFETGKSVAGFLACARKPLA